METIQQPATVLTPPPPSRGIFGTKIPATAAFALAILLFALPLAEIKCGNTTIANQSGIGFAMGSDWKPVGMFNSKDLKSNSSSSSSKEKKGNSQIIIIAVIGLGILGLVLAIANSNLLAGVLGVLAAGGFIYFMIDLKNVIGESMKKDAVQKTTENPDGFGFDQLGNNMVPTLNFTIWYWVALVAFVAAAVFSFMRRTPRRM